MTFRYLCGGCGQPLENWLLESAGGNFYSVCHLRWKGVSLPKSRVIFASEIGEGLPNPSLRESRNMHVNSDTCQGLIWVEESLIPPIPKNFKITKIIYCIRFHVNK